MPLTGHLIDALVVDPRLTHLHRTCGCGHLPRLMEPVADHQPMPIGIHFAAERLDMGRNLSQQCRRQHLPRAVADNLIKQRPARRIGRGRVFNYFEHEGVPS